MKCNGSEKYELICLQDPQCLQFFVRGIKGRKAVADGLFHLCPHVCIHTKAKCFRDAHPKETKSRGKKGWEL